MENLKSYASYFSAYLVNNLLNEKEIKKIILFGSVSRDTPEKDSDVDIFIELKKEDSKLAKEIEKLTSEFNQTREALQFKTKGMKNKIGII